MVGKVSDNDDYVHTSSPFYIGLLVPFSVYTFNSNYEEHPEESFHIRTEFQPHCETIEPATYR